ncbi:hypothetical protein [Amycolatopsis pigmentata]|uniref:Uncharacterized protein n=1 Tax=Amycolatopsis pigmentata TaxID=450801 RepID=A0ABW5FKK5_9PSEU
MPVPDQAGDSGPPGRAPLERPVNMLLRGPGELFIGYDEIANC